MSASKKINLCVLLNFFFAFSLFCQNTSVLNKKEDGLVNWLNFREAQELNKKNSKPFLIDVYTSWCGWCKHMMKTTYSDPGLASYINTYFYPVKFDAETKDTIEYNGVRYFNESTGPKTPHQLAKKFLGNSLSYPSTIFVNNNFQFNLLTQGYLDVRKIEPLLIYTLENIFRTSSYEDFNNKFSLTFYDSLKLNRPERVKWLNWDEAFQLKNKTPKKIMVSISTPWCNSCKVMNKTTFCDSSVADFINKHFYLVELNAETADTLRYLDKIYTGPTQANFPFHSLIPLITKNNFALPSTVFLDEDGKVLECVPFYLHPKGLDPILHYFGENKYLKMNWQSFISGKTTDKKETNTSENKEGTKKKK